MAFGLIIIGDEILSGRRQDKHFGKVRAILAQRGLQLAWALYLGDDRARLTETLARTFAGGDVVFSCGGIGSTPDDHTRQAAAAALGRPLVLHPEAERLIAERTLEAGLPLTEERLNMGRFPEDARIIPNPYNRIPGFAIHGHWFVPGFPDMAWPMLEWVLDSHYAHLFQSHAGAELAMTVRGLAEATITPLMEVVEAAFPGVKVFSLPRLNPDRRAAYEIELGVKGETGQLAAAFDALRRGVTDLGGVIEDAQAAGSAPG